MVITFRNSTLQNSNRFILYALHFKLTFSFLIDYENSYFPFRRKEFLMIRKLCQNLSSGLTWPKGLIFVFVRESTFTITLLTDYSLLFLGRFQHNSLLTQTIIYTTRSSFSIIVLSQSRTCFSFQCLSRSMEINFPKLFSIHVIYEEIRENFISFLEIVSLLVKNIFIY